MTDLVEDAQDRFFYFGIMKPYLHIIFMKDEFYV